MQGNSVFGTGTNWAVRTRARDCEIGHRPTGVHEARVGGGAAQDRISDFASGSQIDPGHIFVLPHGYDRQCRCQGCVSYERNLTFSIRKG